MVKLRASGADVFINIATPKFAALAIRKAAEFGWKPLHIVNSISVPVGGVLVPAGLGNAKDLLSANYLKTPTSPNWKDDPALKEWEAFLQKYYPDANRADAVVVYGYAVAQTMAQVPKQCGDVLTRENVMKQAANLKDFALGVLLPGIKINTSPTDYFPVEQLQMIRFDGKEWTPFGPVISGADGT